VRVVVIANGDWDNEWSKTELSGEIDVLICADGGGNLALASGRTPDVIVGDLDSLTKDNLEKCQNSNTKIKKYPAQKNQTDLELALEYAQEYLESYGKQEDEIILLGAGGKRLDHLLGNIALLIAYAEAGRRIIMKDKTSQAYVMLPGREELKGNKGQEISLLALSEEAVVSSQGLFYEMARLILLQKSPRGISNIFTGTEAELEIHQGIVLAVFLNKEIIEE